MERVRVDDAGVILSRTVVGKGSFGTHKSTFMAKKQKGKRKEKPKEEVAEEERGETEVSALALRIDQNMGEAIRKVEEMAIEPPCIYQSGIGLHVRDVKMFLKSSLAHPVSQENEVCQGFGQKEVLQLLVAIFPEEQALVRTVIQI